jgi:O-antigen/teichoic acid export membrane protein
LKREFIYNIFFLLAINLLVKPLYIFGVETSIQNKVNNFGLYFSMFGFVYLFQVINDPGLQNYNSIYISNNKEEISHYFPRMLGLKLLLLFIQLSLVSTIGLLIGYSFADFNILLGIVGIFFLSTLFFMLRTSLSAYGLYRMDTWLSSIDRLFLIIVLGALLLNGKLISLEYFVVIQLMCYSICVMIAAIILIKQLKISFIPKLDAAFCKLHLSASLPFALIILLTSVVARVDGVIIERTFSNGVKLAGEYAAGYRFIDAANMFGVLYGGLLLPMYSNKFAENESIDEVFSIAYRFLLVVAIVASLTFFFYAEDIFTLIYKKELSAHISALRILFLAILPITLSNAFGPILLAAKHLKPYNITFFFVGLAIIILNLLLLPSYGIMASSCIVLGAWTIILGFMIYSSIKINKISVDSSLVLKTFLILGVSIITYWLFSTQIDLTWMVEIFICPLVILLVAFISKYITIKEILNSK